MDLAYAAKADSFAREAASSTRQVGCGLQGGQTDSRDLSHAQLPWSRSAVMLASIASLAACGRGGGGGSAAIPNTNDAAGNALGGSPLGAASASPIAVTLTPAGAEPAQPAIAARPSAQNAARFLTQASFGAKSVEEIEALRVEGLAHWLWTQFAAPTQLHTSYLDTQKSREKDGKATDEKSYEAVWQQWLKGPDQLRGRMAFALGQVMVISNIAPDIRPYAMSSYMERSTETPLATFALCWARSPRTRPWATT